MSLINCPECNKEVSTTVKKCPHCGYNIQRTNVKTITEKIKYSINSFSKKTKILFSVVSILIIFIIILTVILNCFVSTKERVAIDACKAIVNCLDNEDSFEIVDIYFNNTLNDNTIVETKYQVFVEFSYENSYGGREKDRVLYILTPYEAEYLIESNDEYSAMYNLAEMEIYSIRYDKWEEYDKSQIKKIERKSK